MISVTAAIIEKNGLILAGRRNPGCHLAGYWEFPGGKLEAGEVELLDQRQRFFNNYSIPTMKQLLDHFPQLKTIDVSEYGSVLRGKKQLWLNVLVQKRALTTLDSD